MLKLSMTAALFYTVHFFMLGAVTGAAMNLIGGVRCYTFFHVTPDKRHRWVLIAFMILAAGGAALTWQGPLSLLPMIGSISSGIAFWQKDPKYIRRWALIASPLWFVYNALSHSYPGMLIEVILLVSNLVGEYRFDFRHKSHIQKRLARPA